MQNAWYFSTCMQLQLRLDSYKSAISLTSFIFGDHSTTTWARRGGGGVSKKSTLVHPGGSLECPRGPKFGGKNPATYFKKYFMRGSKMSTLVHSRGGGVKFGSNLVRVVVEWPLVIFLFSFIEKSDVSKIWSGQKSGEDANETKVH